MPSQENDLKSSPLQIDLEETAGTLATAVTDALLERHPDLSAGDQGARLRLEGALAPVIEAFTAEVAGELKGMLARGSDSLSGAAEIVSALKSTVEEAMSSDLVRAQAVLHNFSVHDVKEHGRTTSNGGKQISLPPGIDVQEAGEALNALARSRGLNPVFDQSQAELWSAVQANPATRMEPGKIYSIYRPPGFLLPHAQHVDEQRAGAPPAAIALAEAAAILERQGDVGAFYSIGTSPTKMAIAGSSSELAVTLGENNQVKLIPINAESSVGYAELITGAQVIPDLDR